MPQFPPLIDSRVLRPSESALALKLVSEVDLLRLKTLARLYARGLNPYIGWEDLLQEALTRILVGTRTVRDGVSNLAFVAGVMRSLRSQYLQRTSGRRSRQEARQSGARPSAGNATVPAVPGPEGALVAEQELAAIRRLFAGDDIALRILAGLAEGLTAEEICLASRLSEADYAAARKRMRRVLLREGLTCEPK